MSGRVLEIAKMNNPEIESLDRGRTVFVMTLSPVEVHGPHLPLGTDVRVAEEVRDRALARLQARHPELDFVLFPSCYVGSDTIPGSVDVDSRAVYFLLKGTAEFLSGRGFNYLLVFDNHGGPRHQIAIAKAVRRAYKTNGFFLVAPFLKFFRRMVEMDPELVARVGAGQGACGDLEDSHAGLNETSLMLATDAGAVDEGWAKLGLSSLNTRLWPNLVLGPVARLLGAIGLRDLADDVRYAGVVLCWTAEKNPPTYVGEPRSATHEAGERMLDAHADEALEQLEAAFRGEPPYHAPIGWSLRIIEPSH